MNRKPEDLPKKDLHESPRLKEIVEELSESLDGFSDPNTRRLLSLS